MDFPSMLAVLFAVAVVAVTARIIVVRGRTFLARHRLLLAVTLLPLQPVLGVGVGVLLITQWDHVDGNGLVFGVIAYLAGLIAFGIVTGVQELCRARHR
ncbi:hypothetical protein [Nonomuraea sp. NPDC050202]|uniref:hypothetical protein n=1 Tax=Nonomuraea sp. NPDC050202 TaxID=3155035 RepID=UPI0033EE7A78